MHLVRKKEKKKKKENEKEKEIHYGSLLCRSPQSVSCSDLWALLYIDAPVGHRKEKKTQCTFIQCFENKREKCTWRKKEKKEK